MQVVGVQQLPLQMLCGGGSNDICQDYLHETCREKTSEFALIRGPPKPSSPAKKTRTCSGGVDAWFEHRIRV